MAEKDALEKQIKPENRTNRGIWLGGVGLLLVLVVLWWVGGGEKEKPLSPEPKSVAQETTATPAPVDQKTAAVNNPAKSGETSPPLIPTVTKSPEVKATQPVYQPPPTLGININEFCQRFNKNSERIKAKLRIMNLSLIAQGENQNTLKHVFNENLYLTAKVNSDDGLVVEVDLLGVLNGSLATTVDLNQGIGMIISSLNPELSQAERDSLLDTLGINKIAMGIFNLQEQVSRKGRTYWVVSSRKAGLHFGVKSAPR